MTTQETSILDSVIYRYTPDVNHLDGENRILKETVDRLKTEIDKFKTPPLMICEIRDVKDKTAVIRTPNGNQFFVNIADSCEELRPGDRVLTEQKNLTVIRKTPITRQFDVEKFVIVEKPQMDWSNIGGLEQQVEWVKEVIELPLEKPELFKKVGIMPPKGILLYGSP